MRFLESLERNSIDIAIDVGAAQGSYSWILNRKAREVFSFEPGADHRRYLERVIAGTRIRLVKAAVGRRCDSVQMYTPGFGTNALHSATLSRLNPVVGHPEMHISQVEQVSLDSFFAEKLASGRSIDVLKVDVEGYELEVFLGAASLIADHHPLILCEIEKRHNPEYAALFQHLRAAGYRSYAFQTGNFRPFDGDTIDHLQTFESLEERVNGSYDSLRNGYVNNFFFQHPKSKIKVSRCYTS